MDLSHDWDDEWHGSSAPVMNAVCQRSVWELHWTASNSKESPTAPQRAVAFQGTYVPTSSREQPTKADSRRSNPCKLFTSTFPRVNPGSEEGSRRNSERLTWVQDLWFLTVARGPLTSTSASITFEILEHGFKMTHPRPLDDNGLAFVCMPQAPPASTVVSRALWAWMLPGSPCARGFLHITKTLRKDKRPSRGRTVRMVWPRPPVCRTGRWGAKSTTKELALSAGRDLWGTCVARESTVDHPQCQTFFRKDWMSMFVIFPLYFERKVKTVQKVKKSFKKKKFQKKFGKTWPPSHLTYHNLW